MPFVQRAFWILFAISNALSAQGQHSPDYYLDDGGLAGHNIVKLNLVALGLPGRLECTIERKITTSFAIEFGGGFAFPFYTAELTRMSPSLVPPGQIGFLFNIQPRFYYIEFGHYLYVGGHYQRTIYGGAANIHLADIAFVVGWAGPIIRNITLDFQVGGGFRNVTSPNLSRDELEFISPSTLKLGYRF